MKINISAILVKDVWFEPGDAIPDDTGHLSQDNPTNYLDKDKITIKMDTWFNTDIVLDVNVDGAHFQKPILINYKRDSGSDLVVLETINDVIEVTAYLDGRVMITSKHGSIKGFEVTVMEV